MKKFIFHIILFFIAVVFIDLVYGEVCSYLFSHSKGGPTKTNYYIAKESNEPIMMMGSSRMHHHYNPDIVESITGLRAFNAGVDGNGIVLQYGMLKLIIERYSPQIIVYDVSRFDFYLDDNTKYLENLKPFYGEPSINEIFENVSTSSVIKMKSSLYQYNSKFINLLSDYFIKRDGVLNHGYKPLYSTMPENDLMENAEEVEIDSLKLSYLKSFIKVCRENNIEILFFISPTYNKYITSDYYTVFKNVCYEQSVPLFDFSEDKDFINNKEYYKDFTHLNNYGADIYSKKVSDIIKDYTGDEIIR